MGSRLAKPWAVRFRSGKKRPLTVRFPTRELARAFTHAVHFGQSCGAMLWCSGVRRG